MPSASPFINVVLHLRAQSHRFVSDGIRPMINTVINLPTFHGMRLLVGIGLLTLFTGCAHIAKQFEDADNEASAARHLALAEAGDLESAYYVGFFYEVGGIGLPKDLEKARYWLLYAAEGNYADAQCSAGSSYEDGVLFEQDTQLARYWYDQCMENGGAQSYFHIGSMYSGGSGVQIDSERAKYYFLKGAELGSSQSMYALAKMYARGENFVVDYAKARELLEQAANLGMRPAAYELGRVNRDGAGAAINEVEALKWFRIAAAQRYKRAVYAVDELEARLSAEKIAQAKTLEAEWLAKWLKKE
jgi:TPR repeat protein